MNKNKICLILKDNPDWTGGSQYIKNILFSFKYLKNKERRKLELHLISFENPSSGNKLDKYCEYLHSYYLVKNPLIKSFLLNQKNNKLLELIFTLIIIVKYQINFVFPFPNYLPFFGFRTALWIPDLQHHYLDNLFSKEELQFRDKKFRKILNNSSTLVLSSNDCKKDINKFYGSYDKDIFILNFRANLNKNWLKTDPINILKKYNLPENFFLISNQFWKHKNHLLVLKALDYLKNKKNIKPNIVFTGKLFFDENDYGKEIIADIKKRELNNQIFILGLIPKKDQFLLMRKSISIIQPSLFEGWSTIVEESRSIGKVIILSDLAVHKEQRFSRSIFFKRNSYKDLSLKILYVLKKFKPGPELIIENSFAKQSKVLMHDFAKKFVLLSNLK